MISSLLKAYSQDLSVHNFEVFALELHLIIVYHASLVFNEIVAGTHTGPGRKTICPTVAN